MADSTGLQFTLSLAGIPGLAVVDFTHRERLSAPFELRVTLASRDPEIAPADTLDRNATLTVWQDGEPLRHLHGVVSEFGRGDRGHRRTFYTLVIRPALWRLGLRHNARIFQDVPPQDILATLCAERGLTDVAFALTREPEEREYCVQYRESDLAFVERLAAEEGLFYFHEFEPAVGGAHRLIFADAPTLLPHLGARTYHGRAGGTPPRRHVRKLTQVSRVRPAAVTLKDYTFKQPAYDQLHEHVAEGLGEHGQRGVVDREYEHFDYPGRYKADASGVPFTRVRLEALRAEANTAAAESDLPELAPGSRFTLADHDIDALNRDWQVVAVVHHGEQPQALEEDGVDSDGRTRYYNELVLAPADRAWRPAPPVRPRVDGPQVAFVVGPEGEEIHCDEHGRVKVQFPWDRYADPDTAGAGGEAAERGASAWIRVSQDWAGGGYGSMAIPRIGHEVIVSFLEGDPDQPIITGRTYHAVNTPPYALPAHKTRTVLRTQSHKAEGFNELRFEDATDAEQIWLHAQKDLELLTLNDRTETIRRDSHLAIERHRLGEIHGDDHLTVHGQRHTQVKGEDGQHLTVHGSLHLEAGQAWLTESGRELHIKAGHKVVLNAGCEITLKAGGSFIKLDRSGVAIVGPWIKVNAGGNPGAGSGQAAKLPRPPGEAVPEVSDDVTHDPHLTPLLGTATVTAASWVGSQVSTEEDAPDTTLALDEAVEEANGGEAALHEKAFRWQCRQGQIAAGRAKANRLPASHSQRAELLATAERFERNSLAVEHAKLAQHVYDPGQPDPIGWESKGGDQEFLASMDLSPEDLQPEESGFRAGMYMPNPEIFGDAFEPALAFKGTTMSSGEDWRNNAQQSLNFSSDYYERAVGLGSMIKDTGANVHVTGHSLGGGMASAASRASGMNTTTFNAAGLHTSTIERYGGMLHIPEQENIAAYRVKGEVLTALQENSWGSAVTAAAVGATFGGIKGAAVGALGSTLLAAALPDAAGTPYQLPGRGANPVERHGMEQVIDGLEAQKAYDQRQLAEATGHHC